MVRKKWLSADDHNATSDFIIHVFFITIGFRFLSIFWIAYQVYLEMLNVVL